jgi:hypothetical protein
VRYLAALPINANPEWNFLLADNQARILRALFASESVGLGKYISVRLLILLQAHQGVRVFYPSMRRFYKDVKNGHIDDLLPLDAVIEFVGGIGDHTPSVFHPDVRSAFLGASTPIPDIRAHRIVAELSTDPAQIKLTPDPLDEIDPHKPHDLTFASMANSLWRVLTLGKKIGNTVEGWDTAYEVLKVPFAAIVDWLARFQG